MEHRGVETPGPGSFGAPALAFGEDGVDEQEAREREIFADFLAGTPVEGDEDELDRLMRVGGTLARMQVVSVIRAGEADSVAGALANLRRRRDSYRDVRGDVDDL
jgi:hypothetical protein